MMDLGSYPGATGPVTAQAISGDGKVVVGQVGFGDFQLFSWNGQQGFTPVGSVFSGFFTGAHGTNSDASVVVGTAPLVSGNTALRAFRWTTAGGFTDLGTLGGTSSNAYGISNDGNVVVGAATNAAGTNRAFRWTTSGMSDLGSLVPNEQSIAYGVSGDGNVTVGYSGAADSGTAVIWNAATSSITSLGSLGGGSQARAANMDGSVVVGIAQQTQIGNGSLSERAFRWTAASGMQALGTLGGKYSDAHDVSADGSVVVGYAQQTDGANRAFRWTEAAGMTNLGVLSGETSSSASSVSNDGNTIVGTSGSRAFIWTQAPLQDLGTLQDLANLQLSDITSANTLAQLTATQTRRIRELSSQQCIPGSAQQYCLSAGVGAYTGEAGTSGKQGITQASGGMRLNEQFSIGGNLNLASADLHSESAKQDSALGVSAWAAYQQHPDNLGWQGSASVAVGTSDNTFERGAALSDVQRARANSRMNSTALRVAAGYGIKVDTTLLTPEIALSHARSESDGYTERNVAFPLTLNGASSNDTYATFGVRSQTPLSPKATLHLGVALDALLNDSTDAIRGHSQVPGLSDFTLNSSLDKRRLVPVANVGYSYALDANSSVAAQVQAGTSVYEAQGAVFGVGVQYRYAF